MMPFYLLCKWYRRKLGNKGTRKEKIAHACFNILCISKNSLQKAEPQHTSVPGNFSPFMSFLREKKSWFFFSFSVYFVEPSEKSVECREKNKLSCLLSESGPCTSSLLIFSKRKPLTLEQLRSELHRSTYMQIFLNYVYWNTFWRFGTMWKNIFFNLL